MFFIQNRKEHQTKIAIGAKASSDKTIPEEFPGVAEALEECVGL